MRYSRLYDSRFKSRSLDLIFQSVDWHNLRCQRLNQIAFFVEISLGKYWNTELTIFQQLSELMDAQYALWCWFLLGSGWQGSTWYPLLWIFPRIVTVALKWKTEGNRGGKEHRGYSLNWSWLLDGLKLFHERVMFMMDDITSDSNHSKYWKTFW